MPSVAIAKRTLKNQTGAERIALEHIKYFSSIDASVDLFGEKLDKEMIRKAGATPIELFRWPSKGYWQRHFFASQFHRKLRKKKYDLIIGHGDTLDDDIMFLHNCVHKAHEILNGKPLSPDSGVGRLHDKILGKQKFSRIVVNSKLMQQEMENRYHISSEKIVLLYPGYDAEKFTIHNKEKMGLPIRKKLNISPNDILIGLITSGDFKKRGVDLFIKALGVLSPKTREQIKVIIVGKADKAPYIKKVRESGLLHSIQFLDFVENVQDYFNALDIYVHPAGFEEFGISVLEAMGCGLPIITSKMVGASELFKGDSANLLMESPNLDILVQLLENYIHNKSLREILGEENFKAARKQTWRTHISKFENMLKRDVQVKE